MAEPTPSQAETTSTVIVDTKDALLVCDKDSAQQIKQVVSKLASEN